ncbi:hypothetical protein BJX76DRAFT_338464 [Aspergillus varians]
MRSPVLDACTLNEWADANSNKSRRNSYVHGGDHRSDLDLLTFMMDRGDSVDLWLTVFEQGYGISYYVCRDEGLLQNTEEQLVHKLNVNVDVYALHKWRKLEALERGQQIRKMCSEIISEWLSTEDELFVDGSLSQSLYERILILYKS